MCPEVSELMLEILLRSSSQGWDEMAVSVVVVVVVGVVVAVVVWMATERGMRAGRSAKLYNLGCLLAS